MASHTVVSRPLCCNSIKDATDDIEEKNVNQKGTKFLSMPLKTPSQPMTPEKQYASLAGQELRGGQYWHNSVTPLALILNFSDSTYI